MKDGGEVTDRDIWLPPLTDGGGARRLAVAVGLTVALHAAVAALLLMAAGPLSSNALALSFFEPAISAEVVPLPRPEAVEPVPPLEKAAIEPPPTPPPEPEKEPPKAEEPPKPDKEAAKPDPPPEAEKPVPPAAPEVARTEPPPAAPFAPLSATPAATPMPPPAPAAPPPAPQIVTQSTPPSAAVTAEEDTAPGNGGSRLADGFGDRVPELPRPDRLPQVALAAPDDWSDAAPGDDTQILLVPPEVLLGPDVPRPTPSPGRTTAPPTATRMPTMVSRAGNAAGPAPYPYAARANNLEGDVMLRVGIGADGSVVAVNVLRSSGHPVLDDAAMQSARGWRFRPPQYTGPGHVVGPVWVEVPISYRSR